ncbi:hypothetical protein SBRCBS47491_000846 [Sporothrix bragantina]|uniref:F-box domain-containing protein n=1 Tax=Sporothrix bragantina TaxID=671064 RepID=A0ABP0ATT2_9PEZI
MGPNADRPAQSLERLPVLVLERICHFVDDEGDTKSSNGDNRRSLWALALVSRRCAAATCPQRFCQLHVRLTERDAVEATVKTLLSNLGDRTAHVRRLRVSGGTTREAAEHRRQTGEILPAHHESGRGDGSRWTEARNQEAGPGVSDDPDDALGPGCHDGHDVREVFGYGGDGVEQDNKNSSKDSGLHVFCRPRWPRHNWLEQVVYGAVHDYDTMNMTLDKDPVWEPVALLIRSLPGLRDLVWDCCSCVPDVILETVHAAPPFLRLHVHRFALHSLTQYTHHTKQSPISSGDYALVTSPRLVSLVAVVERRLLMSRVNYTTEAIVEMMRDQGLAPNLRHVWLNEIAPTYSFGGDGDGWVDDDDDGNGEIGEGNNPGLDIFAAAMGDQLPKWQGFLREKEGGETRAVEESSSTPSKAPFVSLVLWRDLTIRSLGNILGSPGVDLSCLRHLTVIWHERVVRRLIKIARAGRLVGLDHFTLLQAQDDAWIELSPNDYDAGEYDQADEIHEAEYLSALGREPGWIQTTLNLVLFRQLPPLGHLQYSGALRQSTLRRILNTHGRTLRHLDLSTTIKPVYVNNPDVWVTYMDPLTIMTYNDLPRLLPNLEELRINMRRSHGDSAEVDVYETLARLSRLERLHIQLFYRVHYTKPVAMTSEEELSIRRYGADPATIPVDIMQEAYTNCAMDETLARSIFETVRGTMSNQDDRLRHLRLDIQRQASFTDVGSRNHAFMDMLRYLARPQTVRRNAAGDVVVTEINRTATRRGEDAWAKEVSLAGDESSGGSKLDNCLKAFRNVWPPTRETEWWQDWKSLPLKV